MQLPPRYAGEYPWTHNTSNLNRLATPAGDHTMCHSSQLKTKIRCDASQFLLQRSDVQMLRSQTIWRCVVYTKSCRVVMARYSGALLPLPKIQTRSQPSPGRFHLAQARILQKSFGQIKSSLEILISKRHTMKQQQILCMVCHFFKTALYSLLHVYKVSHWFNHITKI